MKDIFRPTREPARTIYDAFQEAALKRDKSKWSEWIQKEREAVYEAAVNYARNHDLTVPTMNRVEFEEDRAMGHTDYGAQWAYGISEYMTPKKG